MSIAAKQQPVATRLTNLNYLGIIYGTVNKRLGFSGRYRMSPSDAEIDFLNAKAREESGSEHDIDVEEYESRLDEFGRFVIEVVDSIRAAIKEGVEQTGAEVSIEDIWAAASSGLADAVGFRVLNGEEEVPGLIQRVEQGDFRSAVLVLGDRVKKFNRHDLDEQNRAGNVVKRVLRDPTAYDSIVFFQEAVRNNMYGVFRRYGLHAEPVQETREGEAVEKEPEGAPKEPKKRRR